MKQIQLEYFIEVVEQNNFTKAAEKLFISQSALSKSIQSLEKELDTSLFTRDPRELKLTEEGRLVYHYAKDVLNYWHDRTAELFSSLNYKKGPCVSAFRLLRGAYIFQGSSTCIQKSTTMSIFRFLKKNRRRSKKWS